MEGSPEWAGLWLPNCSIPGLPNCVWLIRDAVIGDGFSPGGGPVPLMNGADQQRVLSPKTQDWLTSASGISRTSRGCPGR